MTGWRTILWTWAMLGIAGCADEAIVLSVPEPAIPLEVATGAVTAQPADAVDLDPSDEVVSVKLVAAATEHGYAYNGQVPGPTIRMVRGATLRVELVNELDSGTTIHWHGLHVPNAMDGVPWKIGPVPAGQTFIYEFPVEQAGTYWYHPHFDTERQVDLGLYGALIVTDPAEPTPDQDLVFVLDGPGEHVPQGAAPPVGTGPVHFEHHAAVVDEWLVNGESAPTVTLAGGTWARARFVNASNSGYVDLRMPDLRVIAADQGLLAARRKPNLSGERVVLGPGDRIDLEWLVGTEGFVVETAPYTMAGGPAMTDGDPTWSASKTLVRVEVETPAAPPSEPEWGFSFAKPTADPGHTDVVYTMTGSDSGGEWTINGEVFPNITIEQFPLGSVRIIEVRNLSRTEHPFHIHGHAFEVVSVNGVAPKWRRIEDTVNVGIRERVRLRLVANNPGEWMTHCHILSHADDGMMTVIRVGESP